jgi:hypothetical protein
LRGFLGFDIMHTSPLSELLSVDYGNANLKRQAMSSFLYLLLFILPAISVVLLVLFLFNKKNHTELYSEGVRNENDGRYNLALHNYEDALSEVRKHNINNKFGEKIAQRIKILRTTIDYEKNFQDGRTQSIASKGAVIKERN